MQSVLIIDDNLENLKLTAKILSENSLKIYLANSGDKGIDIAKLKLPDLIILDIQMPDVDGFEVCQRIKEIKSIKEIPIIFMTAFTDEEHIDKAYKAGGVDYITKPIKKLETIARVKLHLKLAKTIKNLEKAVVTDGLTNLYNHKKIFEELELEIKRAVRYNSKLSIMMADIDFFKKINDNYGHQTGDLVLEKISSVIKNTIRDTDIAGRYGGEEFLIIFPNVTLNEACIGAERIRENIQNLSLDQGIKITISGGVAEYKNESILEFIEKADLNLYKAKDSGRNKIIC